jgi:hypothetical protein
VRGVRVDPQRLVHSNRLQCGCEGRPARDNARIVLAGKARSGQRTPATCPAPGEEP